MRESCAAQGVTSWCRPRVGQVISHGKEGSRTGLPVRRPASPATGALRFGFEWAARTGPWPFKDPRLPPDAAGARCGMRIAPFFVQPAFVAPKAAPAFHIRDRYINGTPLRLRRVETAATGECVFKLCKTYPPAAALGTAITNLHLDTGEYGRLAVLPGADLVKQCIHVREGGNMRAVGGAGSHARCAISGCQPFSADPAGADCADRRPRVLRLTHSRRMRGTTKSTPQAARSHTVARPRRRDPA